MDIKKCERCGKIKSINEFYYKTEKGTRKYYKKCKECILEERRAYYTYGSMAEYNKARKRPDMIKCKVCNVVKDTKTCFYRNSCVCKACESKKNKLKYASLSSEIKEKRKEYSRNYAKDYRKRNEFKIKMAKARLKREYTLSGVIMNRDMLDVLIGLYGGRCLYCGEPVYNTFELDHIIPLSLGGSTGFSNIVISCEFCNISKNNNDPFEYCKVVGVNLVGVLKKHMQIYKALLINRV